MFSDMSLAVTISLALFAVVFGTRHTDATEHQDGLILAIATESLVKLVAITTVGLVVVFGIFDGFGDVIATARASPMIMSRLAHETPLARWIVLTVLSAFAVLMLPRQFHVTVVENRSPSELRLARVLFPLYLVAINLFVVPVAIAGLSTFGGAGDRDLYVLTVLLAHHLPVVTLAAFLGGFSAATAMVIVASVAVAIMVSNDIVMPLFLRPNVVRRGAVPGDFGSTILTVRRTAIFGVMLLGYFYYSTADLDIGLASIGLLSFAAIAQFAPPLLGGLVWRQANARGAIAGLSAGMAVWTILLFVPSVGGPSMEAPAAAVLDFLTPGPAWASGPGSDPLVNAVVLSLLANMALFVAGSLSRAPKPLERIQAGVFIPQRSTGRPLTRALAHEGLGRENWNRRWPAISARPGPAARSAATRSPPGIKLVAAEPADMALVRAAEQLLASAIGSASARLVLSLLFQKTDDTSPETARLLDEASEALQYNHDLLETALGQMDQGISVFDGSRRLTVWNKRFRTLLDLPDSVGQVGFPLEKILDILVSRGDVAAEDREAFVRNRLTTTQSFQLTDQGEAADHRDPLQPDAGQGLRHDLCRHHGAGRRRPGTQAGQRDAGGARRPAHRRAHRRQLRTEGGAGGRRGGQHGQDAVPGRRRPRHPAAAECRPALFILAGGAPRRVRGPRPRTQHQLLAGIRGNDPQRRARSVPAGHRGDEAAEIGVPAQRHPEARGDRLRAHRARKEPRIHRRGDVGPSCAPTRTCSGG